MNRETKLRCILPLLAVALLVAACGSSDSDEPSTGADLGEAVADTAAATGGDEGDPGAASGEGAGGAESGAVGPPSDVAMLPFDASVLPATPVAGVVAGSGGGGATVPAVVGDTCAALPADVFSTVVEQTDAELGFGASYRFTASGDGAACRYEADTHVVEIVIGPADVVTASEDSPAVRLPLGAGDVSATPWASDPAVTILSEDSFGLDTPFAAHATAVDVGIVVNNAGGTGLDPDSDGELWARLAAAAATGVAGVPALDDGGGDDDAAGPVDPCAVWSAAEIDAFLTDVAITSNTDVTMSNGCVWTGPDFEVEVRLVIDDAQFYENGSPVTDGSIVLTNVDFFTRVWIEQGAEVLLVEVQSFGEEPLAGYDASVALAENLASRLG